MRSQLRPLPASTARVARSGPKSSTLSMARRSASRVRARPLRAGPSSTIARKTCGAGGHEDALSRQLARISLSSRISDWTSVHLCKISPSETRLAASPNGSARGATEDWGEEGLFVGAGLMPSGRIATWMPCRCAPRVLSLTSTVRLLLRRLLRQLLRHRYSDPRIRQCAAVEPGPDGPCEKPSSACRDASEHCHAPSRCSLSEP